MEEMTYRRLRKQYLTEPEKRTFIFEDFWNLFENDISWIIKDGIRKGLSILEVKADFCLAINRLIITTRPNASLGLVLERLKTFFRLEMLRDVEENKSLKAPLLKGLGYRARSNDGKDIPKKDIKNMRILFELDAVNRFKGVKQNTDPTNRPNSLLKEQEMEYTKGEMETFVTSNFSQEDWEDFVYHNIYGESLRDVAHYRKKDFTTIKRRTDKVKKAVGEYYDSNGKKHRYQ